MKPSPAYIEATLSGPENFSEQQTAFRFEEARAHVRNAMRCAEADGISSETLALALIGEALPPIVHEHGPIWAATVLMKLARRLRARAFSSEVGTGSREENASKQKIRVRF
jgi:hypothetical protein